MQTISNLQLREAKPSDRPHILLWDSPNEVDLEQILYYNKAQRINYRDNLLSRIDESKDRFLLLHEHLDRELEAIRSICSQATDEIVLLEGLDYLITYLSVQPSNALASLWHRLSQMRQLESILWILLPTKLTPPNWPEKRMICIPAP